MNRVLWLINPFTFSMQDAYFAASFAKEGGYALNAVMLKEWQQPEIPLFSTDPLFPSIPYMLAPQMESSDFSKKIDEVVGNIHQVFQSTNIEVLVSSGVIDADEGVVTESRFADMILVQSGLTFSSFDEATPSSYVLELLPRVQCPVLIASKTITAPKEIIFTYNGGYSSLYAIRQFTYLFSYLKHLPVTVIYVEESKNGLPHEQSLKVFLHSHYSSVTIKVLGGLADAVIVSELMHNDEAIVTFGAFGRNKISRFFRHSTAEGFLKMINIPVFVTHP